MDSSSLNSDIPDLIDILRPPTKSACGTCGRHKPESQRPGHHKIIQDPFDIEPTRSVSLVLEKTVDIPIIKNFLDQPTTGHSKKQPNSNTLAPSVKLTVIPRNIRPVKKSQITQIQSGEGDLKTVVSNQDSADKSKYIYLVLKGYKSEKVYEIKTTESNSGDKNRTRHRYNDGNISPELRYLKGLLDKLKMEKNKKKKRDSSREKKQTHKEHTIAVYGEEERKQHNCGCPVTCVGSSKSRVRITGKLGVTKDDKYVLRCAATINDGNGEKPIETFTKIGRKVSQNDVTERSSDTEEGIADTLNQTEFWDYNTDAVSRNSKRLHKENIENLEKKNSSLDIVYKNLTSSQATQVNMQITMKELQNEKEVNNKKKQVDQNIQCSCTNLNGHGKVVVEKSDDENIVLVSVYPQRFAGTRDNGNTTSSDPKSRNSRPRPSVSPIEREDYKTHSRSPSLNKTLNRRLGSLKPLSASAKSSPARSRTSSVNSRSSSPKKCTNDVCPAKSRNYSVCSNDTCPSKSRNFSVSSNIVDRLNKDSFDKLLSKKVNVSRGKNAIQPKNNAAIPRSVSPKNIPKTTKSRNPSRDKNQGPINKETQKNMGTSKPKTTVRSKNNSPASSRSSSPGRATASRNQSRDRSPSKKQDTRKIMKPSKLGNTKKSTPAVSKTNSPARNTLKKNKKNSEKNLHKTVEPKKGKKTNKKKLSTVTASSKVASPKSVIDNETNTAGVHYMKQALIEKYTKELEEEMNTDKGLVKKSGSSCPCYPLGDVSNVTVNIDGDSEYYDLLFHKDKLTTDFRVKKTLKPRSPMRQRMNHEPAMNTNKYYSPPSTNRSDSHIEIHVDSTTGIFNELEHKRASRLNVKDSIEISHNREDRGGHSIKITQTNEYNPDYNYNDFHAPVKHHRRDDSQDLDSMDRDHEMRGLLGAQKNKHTVTKSKPKDVAVFGQDVQQCFNILYENKRVINQPNVFQSKKSISLNSIWRRQETKKTVFTQCDLGQSCKAPLCEQLIVNRNKIICDVTKDKKLKKKPIILSKKDLNRIRKTIQNVLVREQSKHNNMIIKKSSLLAVGEVAKKTRTVKNFNKDTQTELVNNKKIVCNVVTSTSQINKNFNQVTTNDNTEIINENKVINNTTNISKVENDIEVIFSAKIQRRIENKCMKHMKSVRRTMSSMEIHYTSGVHLNQVNYSSSNVDKIETEKKAAKIPLLLEDIPHEGYSGYSIHTLFKGHKRTATPNLGTSAYSLCPEKNSNCSRILSASIAEGAKERKPFLRRLMSCLVMRTKISNAEIKKTPRAASIVECSIDSYYINTSLAPFEVSSSLFDTSASFYTNHSVHPFDSKHPICSKIRKGFFSSVRGFFVNTKN